MAVRRNVCQMLCNYRADIEPFIKQDYHAYIKQMARNGTWEGWYCCISCMPRKPGIRLPAFIFAWMHLLRGASQDSGKWSHASPAVDFSPAHPSAAFQFISAFGSCCWLCVHVPELRMASKALKRRIAVYRLHAGEKLYKASEYGTEEYNGAAICLLYHSNISGKRFADRLRSSRVPHKDTPLTGCSLKEQPRKPLQQI